MINALSSVSLYQSLQSTAAKPAKLPSETYSQALSDKVSISSAAREMFAADSPAMAQSRTPRQEKRLNELANAAPGVAEQAVENSVMAGTTIFYDISDEIANGGFMRPDGSLKLSSTGRLVDKAFIDRLESEISLVNAQIRGLYTAEKDKGTPPVEIMGKVFDLINSQSSDYLEATGWGEFKNRAAA